MKGVNAGQPIIGFEAFVDSGDLFRTKLPADIRENRLLAVEEATHEVARVL